MNRMGGQVTAHLLSVFYKSLNTLRRLFIKTFFVYSKRLLSLLNLFQAHSR